MPAIERDLQLDEDGSQDWTALQARLRAAEASLARAVIERDAWAQELFESKRFIAELVVARQVLTDELVRLNGLLAGANQEQERAVHALQMVHASTSWQMTGPVRAMMRAMRRA